MAELKVSPLAAADMQEIGDYISRELRNPEAAFSLMQRMHAAMSSLQEYPQMGAPLLAEEEQSAVYRYLVCGSYLIFYHGNEDTVYVDRVLYGRRNYMALLFGNEWKEE